MDDYYNSLYDRNCNYLEYYIDTTMEIFEGEPKLMSTKQCHSSLTALDDNLFLPTELYVKSDNIPIIFDSDCTIAMTPHLKDFITPPTPVNKSMKGL